MNQPAANLAQFSFSRRAFLLVLLSGISRTRRTNVYFCSFYLPVSMRVIFETTGPISMIHGFRMPRLNSRHNLTLILMSMLRPLFSVKCSGNFLSIPQTYLGKKLLYHVKSWSVALYRPILCSGRLAKRPLSS